MDIRQITEQWLRANGYDGLTTENCGCDVNDLMPCVDLAGADCKAGYKIPCPGGKDCNAYGDCDFHISTKKPSRDVKNG